MRSIIFGLTCSFLLMSGFSFAETYTYYVPYFSEEAGGGTSMALRNCSATQSTAAKWVVFNQSGIQLY